MATGDRHSDPESSNLATPRYFHRAATLAERQTRRVCAMTMSVGDEAWRVVLLIGSGVVASAQIGKAIISMPLIRDDLTVGLDLAGLIVAIFATLGATMGIGAGVVVGRLREANSEDRSTASNQV